MVSSCCVRFSNEGVAREHFLCRVGMFTPTMMWPFSSIKCPTNFKNKGTFTHENYPLLHRRLSNKIAGATKNQHAFFEIKLKTLYT